MFAIIANHKKINHTKAKRTARASKKIINQKKLKNNCTPKFTIAGLLSSLVFVMTTRYKATPIRT